MPDVYQGSLLFFTMFFSIVPKIVILVLLSRLYISIFYMFIPVLYYLFVLVALMSIIFATIVTLYQSNLKRLIAYSGIANAGFMILGLSMGTIEGLYGLFIYLYIYIIVLFTVWVFILLFRKLDGTKMNSVGDVSYLSNYNLLPSLIIGLSLFSLCGIPPLAGFFGKLFLFFAILKSYNFFIVIFLIVFSVLACVYYIRMVQFLFFRTTRKYIYFIVSDERLSLFLICGLYFNILFLVMYEPFALYIYNLVIDNYMYI